MTIVVNAKNRDLFPPSVRRQAGIKIGDELEIRVSGKIITMLPKPPNADDDDTPEQRRVVDAQIAEGLDDIRKGRVSRRSDTVDEMLASLKAGKKTARQRKT